LIKYNELKKERRNKKNLTASCVKIKKTHYRTRLHLWVIRKTNIESLTNNFSNKIAKSPTPKIQGITTALNPKNETTIMKKSEIPNPVK